MSWFMKVAVRTLLAFIIFPTLMWIAFQFIPEGLLFPTLIGLAVALAISTLVTLYILDKIVPPDNILEDKKGELFNSRRVMGWIAFALVLLFFPAFILFFFSVW